MSSRDTQNAYGSLSRFNHWLGAAIVITMLAIGLYFHEMPRGDEKSYWMGLHIGIGALAFLFIAFRVIWRLISHSPHPADQAAIWQKISKLTHILLLLGIVVMFISGPVLIWTAGRPINVFDWFSIPSPIERMHDLHEMLEGVHKVVSRVLLVLISLHILATLKHLLFNSGALRGRMWGKS